MCASQKVRSLRVFEAIFETNNIETITADKTTVAKASCFSTSKNLDHSFLEKKTNCAMRK